LAPGDQQIQKQLGISLKYGQDYEGALSVFKGLVRQRPESAELDYLLGDTLLDLQRTEEAIPLLRHALQADPQLLAAHRSLARAELAVGNAAAAIPHLKVALTSDEDGSLHYQLARAYQATGKSQLAKQILLDYQKIQESSTAAKDASRRDVAVTPP
jgi:predicted Zn-dependent protease